MESFEVKTSRTEEDVDITPQVRAALAKVGLRDGAVLVYCPHTTAGIYINEGADPDVSRDVRATLARMVPRQGPYRHAEGNSAAHIGSTLTGNSTLIPVTDGRLALGTWQHVFFAEFDGPRTRTVLVQFLAGMAS